MSGALRSRENRYPGSGKTEYFRRGGVELGLESEFVHAMVKGKGEALRSKQGNSMCKSTKNAYLGKGVPQIRMDPEWLGGEYPKK